MQNFVITEKQREEASISLEKGCGISTPSELQLKYAQLFPGVISSGGTKVSGEATPSYLLGGETIARRVHNVEPRVRLIVILRDPVLRAYSHYKMTADESGTEAQKKRRGSVQGRSFEELIQDDLNLLKNSGVTSNYCLNASLNEYSEAASVKKHGSHGYVGRGLYALQLEQWLRIFPRDQFLVVRLSKLASSSHFQQEMDRVFRFVRLKPHHVTDMSPKNSRLYDPMNDRTKAQLSKFYKDHNAALSRLLGENFSDWI